jgi:hypothetical protein
VIVQPDFPELKAAGISLNAPHGCPIRQKSLHAVLTEYRMEEERETVAMGTTIPWNSQA